MKHLAIYGKGGIGKSTISAGISTVLARSGKRVLHIGCDPKADSTLVLVRRDTHKTLMDAAFSVIEDEDLEPSMYLMKGRHGITAIEVGGPEAGMGCSGQAMTRGFEILEEHAIVDPAHYDVTVFDVLGDVVCGGFAAPMRTASHTMVAIVVSEEMMACYAANNIAKACRRYAEEGLSLAGLILNVRTLDADLSTVHRFADALGTRILATLPRDAHVGEAELRRRSVIDYAPEAPFAVGLTRLSHELMALEPEDCPVPTPLKGDLVRDVMRGPVPPLSEDDDDDW